jgi:hypothetical protein
MLEASTGARIPRTARAACHWGLALLATRFEHYNTARPHRALDLQPPIARSDPVVTSGEVICTQHLGGLSREYSREPMPAAA